MGEKGPLVACWTDVWVQWSWYGMLAGLCYGLVEDMDDFLTENGLKVYTYHVFWRQLTCDGE